MFEKILPLWFGFSLWSGFIHVDCPYYLILIKEKKWEEGTKEVESWDVMCLDKIIIDFHLLFNLIVI